MDKVWAVIRREFISRVQSRAFVISTVLGPLLMGALFMMPILLEKRQTAPRHVVVLDAAGGDFGRQVADRLRTEMRDTVTHTIPRYRVEYVAATGRLDQVRDSLVALIGLRRAGPGALDGVLVLWDSTLATGKMQYDGANVGSPNDMNALERAVRPLVIGARLERAGVNPDVVAAAQGRVELRTERVSQGKLTGQSGDASFLLAYVMSFMLYLALLLYGMQVMSSVVEEKSSRIVEVLVSSLTPFQLLLGKVVGVASVALLQLSIWAGTAMVLTTFRLQVAGAFGASPRTVSDLPIPTVSPAMLVVFLGFFVLGFLFYSAMYAAVGSMCNSHQEAQQSQTPVTLFVAAGLMLMFSLLGEPNGTMAHVLSLVPFFAPFVTPVRYSLSPLPWSELLLSVLAMVAGLVVVVWIAARIYRVGILSYGKKPRLAELARWVRTA
ncbi:MAG TPA: ABC transporter permease [Gemmatimonadales bacterium]|jgi:ABC-2 type transport system permease protein|nr:ABC transporter permease [Gemmatimonadales bacterium]